jgi:hypothetical protein
VTEQVNTRVQGGKLFSPAIDRFGAHLLVHCRLLVEDEEKSLVISFDIFHLSFASHARNLIGSVAVGSVALVYLVTRNAFPNDKMKNVK